MKNVRKNSNQTLYSIDDPNLQLNAYMQDNTSLYLMLNTKNSPLSTRLIPSTLDFITQNYPSVLRTQCFNPDNLSFKQEITNTEIGHLFEHILIQILIETHTKLRSHISLDIDGRTSWNWTKESPGIFHIQISNLSSFTSTDIQNAITSTYQLTQKILSLNKTAAINLN